jgi:glycosyltransferase involved in cell wall biosynthesis
MQTGENVTTNDKGSARVLQVVGHGMVRDGVQTWLMHILRHIDRERFRMDFVVEREGMAYDDEIRSLGSRIIVCPHHRRVPIHARNFGQILRDKGPYDVVHSHFHHYNGLILRWARQAGVPVRIAHSHTDYSQDDRKRGVLWRMIYVNLMRQLLVQNATVGLAVSRKAASALYGAAWEADPRWRILYYGIDLKPFQSTVDATAVRAELGIPADTFVVGHVGRFDEQKNHRFLVKIAAEIARYEPRVRFLLVGDGPLRPIIEQQVAQAGIVDKVVFAGVRSDVPRLMLGAMDVFVFPSFYEGLPLVGIEAQAAGLPLILSDDVSEEVGVINPLIQRLSLSQPASLWAQAVLAVKDTIPPITQRDALKLLEESHFTIAHSVRELEAVYAG